MKNEAEFKRVFNKSVRAHKGFCMPLAAPMISGIPDLFVAVPGYVPIMLEAKWLGEVVTKFNKKINYSPLQKHWMNEICRVNAYTAFGLIGFKLNGEIFAVLTPSGVSQITHDFEDLYPYAVYSKKVKTFNLTPMFKESRVPRLSKYRNANYKICDLNIMEVHEE